MDDIAAMAGVNKATLHYHIDGKEKIDEVVLYRHVKTFADVLEKRLEGCDDPVEGLLEVIGHHAEVSTTDDRATRTVAHELAGGSTRTRMPQGCGLNRKAVRHNDQQDSDRLFMDAT